MHYFYLYPNPNFRQIMEVCLSGISRTGANSERESSKPSLYKFLPTDPVNDRALKSTILIIPTYNDKRGRSRWGSTSG